MSQDRFAAASVGVVGDPMEEDVKQFFEDLSTSLPGERKVVKTAPLMHCVEVSDKPSPRGRPRVCLLLIGMEKGLLVC